ncbi:hypothetical protein ESP131_04060 [Exiguobacterium sp. U13-1]|uniref:immunoglobulin-like domain-containing protein n=1 Tax=Exiguobacterium TaxID=33986 RepID=UPI00085952B7|nr:immunoglobulin-like domain-containing protein [Exiguobacterium sp. U13-1]AOS99485.1 hypothetical protein ESP131_04060 [Exiguobacterium sp. U13-1]
MIKKWILYLILIALVIGTIPMNVVEGAADVTKPTLESLMVDKTTVKVGDVVNITIKASDEGSGIKWIYFSYEAPQTGNEKEITMTYDTAADVYRGQIRMEEDMPSGTWKPKYLFIYDKAGNVTDFYSRDARFTEETRFELSDTTLADVKKPTLESLVLDKNTAKVGDVVNITIKASDEGSGIKWIHFSYEAPQTGNKKEITMTYDAAADVYRGQIRMEEDMPSGTWKPKYLFIYDKAGNVTDFYSRDARFTEETRFELSDTTLADVKKPTLESLVLDKNTVKVGDVVNITIKASDEGSGIKWIHFSYEAPQTGNKKEITMTYDATADVYRGQIRMEEDMPSGTWKPKYLFIYDKAGNVTDFYGRDARFTEETQFILEDYQSDKVAPIFKSLSLSQTFLDQTKPLEIKVRATDDTKIKSVKVTYQHSSSLKEQIVALSPSTNLDEYQTSLQLTADLDAGEWKISSVEVEDLNGNKTIVTEGLSSYTFMVFARIKPLGKTFYTGNTSLTYKAISGDLYIGPKAIATLSGTTVYGNVYVLGAMRIYGGVRVTGTIYANSFSYGSGSLYQGGVVISGSNNISSMTASNNLLNKKLPFEIYDEPLVESDGKITFSGATVPVVDVTLEGEKLNINSDGTFRVKDYSIGEKRQLDFVFQDIFGNTWTKSYNILDRAKPVVTSSLSSGIYVEGEKIVLSATKGAKIHYTTDGTTPTASSPVFINSIPIKGDMQIRYIAIDALGIHSDIGIQQFYVYSIEAFLEKESILKGSGTPGMSINVIKDGKSIAETVINDSKRFELKLDQQKIGTRLTVVAEVNGLKNKEYSFLVEDHTPPAILMIDRVTNRSTTVTGQAEPGAKITMLIGETTVEFITDASGRFSHPVSQLLAGTMISLRASDASNNQSEKVEHRVSDVIKPIILGVTKKTINLGQTFNPSDRVTATDETDGNLTSKIKITGTVDSKRAGNYTLIYTVMDQAGNIAKVSRVITVKDSIKPVISGAKDITVALNQKFDVRKSVSAKDNVDGMLTKSIKVSGSVNSKKIGTYKLTYSVSDKAGNQTTVTRKVIVKDMTKPVIIGATTKTIKYKSLFNPMTGVRATDNLDGSLTKKIKVSGTVNTKKKGAYYLTYRVSDKAGNQISIKRKIIVK